MDEAQTFWVYTAPSLNGETDRQAKKLFQPFDAVANYTAEINPLKKRKAPKRISLKEFSFASSSATQLVAFFLFAALLICFISKLCVCLF